MNLFLRRLISGSMKFIKETLPCCVSLLKPSESDRLPKLNASLLLSILSFFFFCYRKLFFNDPFSTWSQHWKPLPRFKTPKRRFTRIVRSNLSFLLCRSAPKYFNRITSDVPYTNTDTETSKTKRTKFSDRFCKDGDL